MGIARTSPRVHRTLICALLVLPAVGTSAMRSSQPPAKPAEAFWQEVPAAAFKFEMIPIPGSPESGIKPFWISRREITWEAFDVYMYALDEELDDGSSDAVTRPTKPYLPPDRGFGHEGFAAISMSYKSAVEFCRWLSARSGRTYRLPTEVEWEHACLAGSPGPWSFDDPASAAEFAWFKDNSDRRPRRVGSKKPNAWGLHDMHGNVAEWVTGSDGKPVVKGGSYLDALDGLRADGRVADNPDWNRSDPQIPKSQWWLADGPFIGFRVVCEMPASANRLSD